MQIPDLIGCSLNEARRVIRTNCPNLSIVIQETHSKKEPEFMDIEKAIVIKQSVLKQEVRLLVAFFGEIYIDKIVR